MRAVLAAGVAVIALHTLADAAESTAKKPRKAAPQIAAAAPAPAFSWTGCYAGGQLGGGWGHKIFSNPDGFELSPFGPVFARTRMPLDNHASGILGGGQAGCRYQFASHWVVGVGGDFAASNIFSSKTFGVNPPGLLAPATFETHANGLITATANVGYAFDRLLLYTIGGAAWVRDKYGVAVMPEPTTGSPADFRASETRSGWTAGAGMEYAFAKNLSAKVEYDFYDFGERSVPFVNQIPLIASPFGDASIRQRIQSIKLGVNYYFWTPTAAMPEAVAPLVTKAPPAVQVAPLAPAPGDITWTQTFASEARYFSWRSTRGTPTNTVTSGPPLGLLTSPGSGSELYVPYAAQLVGQTNDFRIELLGRGGWVDARQTTTGLTGQVQTATDTVTSATVTYLGFQGFQPFAGVQLNLPTGLAALPQTAVSARMDPDLVDIATFGEGFNIGPTLGFNLPLTNSLLLSFSVGYTHRGQFVRETPFTPTEMTLVGGGSTKVDPGEVFTGTTSVGFQVGQLTTKLTGTISQDTTQTLANGMPFVHPGRTYLAAGFWTYAWPQDNIGVTTLTASASHTNPNEVLFLSPGAPTTLLKEPFDTNSNLYRVGIEHLFAFGQTAFGPTGSFLLRDANGYDPTTLQFVPQKERWAVGMQARYATNQTVTFNARVERIWTHENENPSLDGFNKFSVLFGGNVTAFTVPAISSNGWQFAVGATASF